MLIFAYVDIGLKFLTFHFRLHYDTENIYRNAHAVIKILQIDF